MLPNLSKTGTTGDHITYYPWTALKKERRKSLSYQSILASLAC